MNQVGDALSVIGGNKPIQVDVGFNSTDLIYLSFAIFLALVLAGLLINQLS